MKQATFAFAEERTPLTADEAASPSGYKGLYAFHKYWGKKPHEILGFLIDTLSAPGSLVLDPFVGSGVCAREATIRDRRFVGVDLNPHSIQLTELMVSPPEYGRLRVGIDAIEDACCEVINRSYALEDGSIATHYLWDSQTLSSVWTRSKNSRKRDERYATDFDRALIESFNESPPVQARPPRFFSNSRINTKPDMQWDNLLTKRAQRNLRILLNAISNSEEDIRRALELCLTASVGQMTKMVFAVTGRGKKSGIEAEKIEVGSWVIGYWCPKTHFEVNVWNCFERRAKKLLSCIKSHSASPIAIGDRFEQVVNGSNVCALINADATAQLKAFPSASVELVITDPPHSDRVPYLELSELWNSLLGRDVDFAAEVVISNAKERGKSESEYIDSMKEILSEISRVLMPNGFLVVLFNSVNRSDWEIFRHVCEPSRKLLHFLGSFPCKYSAGSVVQDNRAGSLESDVALVFGRRDSTSDSEHRCKELTQLPGWTSCSLSDLLETK